MDKHNPYRRPCNEVGEMKLIMILLWATFGAWAASTVRVAQDGHVPSTLIAITITALLAVIALATTIYYENERPK